MHAFLFSLSLVFASFASASGLYTGCRTHVLDHSRAEEFPVHRVVAPTTVEELQQLVRATRRPIAIRGGGFSMGGQTAAEDGVVVDMKNMNQILELDVPHKTVRVQAGATWRDIQKVIDLHGLSIKIMQSYNNFQVGGSLSVNAHGRYNGYGPLITSVQEIKVLLADGSVVTASRQERPELFAGCIGGYGALGIILEAKLDLVDNDTLQRRIVMFPNNDIEKAVEQFIAHFDRAILGNPDVQLMNADIYPPAYDNVACITYEKTDLRPTIAANMQQPVLTGWSAIRQATRVSIEQLVTMVKRFRGHWIAPRELTEDRRVKRNWEASYDNRELQTLSDRIPILQKIFPFSNRKALLQEYFIPKSKLPKFIGQLRKIYLNHGVNVSNISLRHVPKNNESLLSWSKEECFAVVVYYTQPYGRNRAARLEEAKDWTREVIAAVEGTGGSFYLPYQRYATRDQFNHAYPNAQAFFNLKNQYDPHGRFNNSLWEEYNLTADTYYYRDFASSDHGRHELRDYFTHVFSINDPDRFIDAINVAMENTRRHNRDLNDRNIYDELLKVLPKYANGPLKKFRSTLRALTVQQAEMAKQTADALGSNGVTQVNGYLEIGTPGRYVHPIREKIKISGKVHVLNEQFSPADLVETKWGIHVPAVVTSKRLKLSNYDMILQTEIPTESKDLATMFIGLHHCPPEKLPAFIASIARVLRVGGKFVLRDHDADEKMEAMAFLAHSTYNAGLGISYGDELDEIRNLHPLSYWKEMLAKAGLKYIGPDVKQSGDPTGNTLMVFEKVKRTPEVEQEVLAAIKKGSPLELNLLPGYHREHSNTYMTQAEWFLVDMFEEMAEFTKTHPINEFPFDSFIALFDEVYKKNKAFAELEGVVDGKAFLEYDQMDKFLMFGIRQLFKWISKEARAIPQYGEYGRKNLIERQAFLSKFFQDYADFMKVAPWFKYPYAVSETMVQDLYDRGELTPPPPFSEWKGKRMARALKKGSMRILWRMKIAAKAITYMLQDEHVDPNTQFLVQANDEQAAALRADGEDLTDLQNDLRLVETGRYMPFTTSMLRIARVNAHVVNVAGNPSIAVIVKGPVPTLPQFSVSVMPIFSYQYPTRKSKPEDPHFHTVRVSVSDLPKFLTEVKDANLEVLRVHDF